MLKDLKAHSVQAVVFESPLVSLRAKRETQSGVANTFVGITLYNKEGKEIYVSDIQLNNLTHPPTNKSGWMVGKFGSK